MTLILLRVYGFPRDVHIETVPPPHRPSLVIRCVWLVGNASHPLLGFWVSRDVHIETVRPPHRSSLAISAVRRIIHHACIHVSPTVRQRVSSPVRIAHLSPPVLPLAACIFQVSRPLDALPASTFTPRGTSCNSSRQSCVIHQLAFVAPLRPVPDD
jgi:hypothetical protein